MANEKAEMVAETTSKRRNVKSSKIALAAMAVGLSVFVSACGGNSEESTSSSASASAEATTSSEAAPTTAALPTVADLNAVIATATDPAATVEQKILTVQGGETAPELFETMTQSKAESGANFTVVEPVLPGYTPDSVLATVNFTLPDMAPQTAENVEFVFEDGHWKLSQQWACTLIQNTVQPEQVPPMCLGGDAAPVPAPAEGAAPAAPAPAEAPAADPADQGAAQ